MRRSFHENLHSNYNMNEHFFSKGNTSALKGVAILFMVFAHLFNNMELCGFSHPLLYIEDEPLIHYMTFAMNPVDFFMVLSGYGLYYTFSQGRRNNLKRILKLYIHYWITLIVFVSIGFFVVGSDKYPGSCLDIIYNCIGWKNSYNHETWFLLPYILLTLSSTKIFAVCDKFKPIKVFILSFGIYFLVRLSSRYSSGLIESYQIFKWIDSYLTLQFPFILGMLLCKYWDYSAYKKKLSFKFNKNYILIFALFILFIGIILLRYKYQSIFYPFYTVLFIMCFSLLHRFSWVDKVLMELGKRSTSIWFVHTYFCYYFFQDFIYCFKYPIIIFIVLIIISWCCAIVIDMLNSVIQKLLVK